MGPSHARTSLSTRRATSTFARRSRSSPRPASSSMMACSSTERPAVTACALGEMLPEEEPARKMPRSIYEDARGMARTLANTEAFEQSCRDRKDAIRSPETNSAAWPATIARGAQFECTLAAIAQNLRRGERRYQTVTAGAPTRARGKKRPHRCSPRDTTAIPRRLLQQNRHRTATQSTSISNGPGHEGT